jgi:hypothetical protein
MEVLNKFLEYWEPLWLFLVLYVEVILCAAMLVYIIKEWISSKNLEVTLGKVLSKQVRRLEETHYAMVKKLIRKQKRKK